MRRLPPKFGAVIAASFLLTTIGGSAASAQGATPSPLPAAAKAGHPARATANARHLHLPRAVTRAVTPKGGRASALVQPRAASSLAVQAVTAANITVSYRGVFPANVKSAFQAAVEIWKTKVASSAPIVIDATWANLGAETGILGSAGPTDFVANFTHAPRQNVYYPVALANAISGIDQEPVGTVNNPSGAEISAEFNSAFPSWYLGTTGHPGSSQEDLETVVLHEIGHGLGFLGTFDGITENGGLDQFKGYYGLSGDGREPTIFDAFATDGKGIPLTSATYPSGSAALGNVLRGSIGGGHWGGAWGIRATGKLSRPSLESPRVWQPGSSFSHLDEGLYPGGTANALMTPNVAEGESDHDPGPIMLAMFRDMGWPTTCTSTVPATGPPGPSDTFHPVTPTRIYTAMAYAGRPLDVPATGLAAVPLSGVDAVAVNVEVYRPDSASYSEAFAGCSAFSSKGPSIQQYDPGRTRSQLAVVRVNSEGGIRIWLSRGTALVNVDLAGWFGVSGGDRYHPVATQWLLKGGVTVKAGVPLDEPVFGHGGIPASGVGAVVLKASVTKPTASGWLTVSPGGLNSATGTSAFSPNQRISNLVMVPTGTLGKLRLRLTAGTANVAFEVVGWYGLAGSSSGLLFHPGSGSVRVLSGPRTSQAVVSGLPASTPVLLNVVAGAPSASGWLGVGPAGSSVVRGTQEYDAGHSITGLMGADSNSSGQVRVHPSAGVATLYVDREGWFATS